MESFVARMNSTDWKFASVLICSFLLSACASNRPILYSTSGVAPTGADAAIAECEKLATAAGAASNGGQLGASARSTAKGAALGAATGAVGGAFVGAAARGAGIGAVTGATATLINSLFNAPAPNPAYRAYVERCLKDRGFDPVGWR
jgi:outer membrane lipoprotein SlyB